MPRSSAFLVIGAVVLWGCGPSSQPSAVQLSPEPASSVEVTDPFVPRPELPAPVVQASVASVAGDSIGMGEMADLAASVRAQLARDRAESLDRVRRQLERNYLEEATEDESERARLLFPERRRLRDEALLKARERFEFFADELGPKRVELTNLVGFPDRGELALTRTPLGRLVENPRADSVRSEIRSLNLAYWRDVGLLMDDATAEYNKLLAGVRIESAVREDVALRRARTEAEALFADRDADSLELTRFASLRIPTVPTASIKTSGLGAPVVVDWRQRWESRAWATTAAERMAAQRAWAGANGFVLGNRGRNADGDYRAWRTTALKEQK